MFGDKSNHERTTGTDGLSVGTAMAIESLFNIPTENVSLYGDKGNIKVSDYKIYLINIHTLVRNIITSYDSKTRKDIIKRSDISVEVYNIIKSEIFNITEICNNNNLQVEFYCPDYTKALNNGIFRPESNSTYILTKTLDISNYVFKRLLNDDKIPNLIEDRGVKFKTKRYDVLITTHFAIDLLNHKFINKFTLLESHTGKLVTPIYFSKKYLQISSTNTEEYPFLEGLLYLLGDKHMFAPVPVKLRREIETYYTNSKWRKTDSFIRIRNDLNKQTDLRDLVRRMNFIYSN